MAITIEPRRPGTRVHLTLPARATEQVDRLAAKHKATRVDVLHSLIRAALEQVNSEGG